MRRGRAVSAALGSPVRTSPLGASIETMADLSDSTAPPCPRIGRCPACDQRARLDDGYCRSCLDTPNRGRKWADIAARIRRLPELARSVFVQLDNDQQRRSFIGFFGLPEGCDDPDAPKVSPVKLVTTTLATLALLLVVGCRTEPAPTAAPTPAEPPAVTAAPAAQPTVAHPSATPSPPRASAAPAVAASAKPCPPAPRVSPDALAATWPSRLGQRVRMTGRVERSIDVVHAIVRAGHQRFAVMLSPDRTWAGDREQTFTVMGSSTVFVSGGPQTLPELLLSDPAECGSAD